MDSTSGRLAIVCKKDTCQEALEHDPNAIGVYKECSEDSSLALVGDVLTVLSRLVGKENAKLGLMFLDFIEQERKRINLAIFWSKKLKKLQSVILTLTSV